MKLPLLSIVVLISGAVTASAVAQPRNQLTPVTPQELNKFIGTTVKGRAFAPLGIVSDANRRNGTIMIVSRHGQMATIPAMLLGRYGMQLRAPAISVGEVAQASYGGKAKVPLTGEVEVQE